MVLLMAKGLSVCWLLMSEANIVGLVLLQNVFKRTQDHTQKKRKKWRGSANAMEGDMAVSMLKSLKEKKCPSVETNNG